MHVPLLGADLLYQNCYRAVNFAGGLECWHVGSHRFVFNNIEIKCLSVLYGVVVAQRFRLPAIFSCNHSKLSHPGMRRMVLPSALMGWHADAQAGQRAGGVVTGVGDGRLFVELDGTSRRRVVELDSEAYNAVRLGYAMTVNRAQGVTVEHAMVVADGAMDGHRAYVALTRHRESVQGGVHAWLCGCFGLDDEYELVPLEPDWYASCRAGPTVVPGR